MGVERKGWERAASCARCHFLSPALRLKSSVQRRSVFLRPTLWQALPFWFLLQRVIASRFTRQTDLFCYSTKLWRNRCNKARPRTSLPVSPASQGRRSMFDSSTVIYDNSTPVTEIITHPIRGCKTPAALRPSPYFLPMSWFLMRCQCWGKRSDSQQIAEGWFVLENGQHLYVNADFNRERKIICKNTFTRTRRPERGRLVDHVLLFFSLEVCTCVSGIIL